MKRYIDFLIGVPLIYFLSLFKKTSIQHSERSIKKILIIKLAAAGDTVLLGSVLSDLHQKYPNIQIDWLCSTINYSFANLVPGINQLYNWNGKVDFGLFRLIKIIRSVQYDVIFDLEQWSRGTALLSFFLNAANSVGFRTKGQFRHLLYSESIPKRFDRHEIDEFYSLLSLKIPLVVSRELKIWESPDGLSQSTVLFDQYKTMALTVVIHPGCGHDGLPREWPISQYALLVHWINKNYSCRVFLTGGKDDAKKVANLNKLLSGMAVDLAGRMSWETTISFLKKADIVVSGNTGIMHVAAALQKKQIALHGPTSPVLWGPLNPNAKIISSSCSHCPCLKLGFEYHDFSQSCMSLISLEDVKKAFSQLIDNPSTF